MEKVLIEFMEIFVRKGVFVIYAALLLTSLLWWTAGQKLGVLRSLRWAVSAQSNDNVRVPR